MLLILIAQSAFGFGWSLYLLAPKFQAVVLGAGPELIGYTSMAAGIAGVLCVPFAATGIDRFGRLLFFRIGTGLVLILSIGYLFVDRVGPLLFLLQGCVAAAFVLAFNASAALMADFAPPRRLGQAIGWLGAANVSMNAISTAVGEIVADAFGWNSVFVLGIGSAVCALVISLRLRAAPVRNTLPSPSQAPERFHTGPLISMCAAAMLVGAVFTAGFTFVQPFALERGAQEVRTFFLGFTVAAVACRVLLSDFGDRRGRLRVSIASCIVYGLAALSCVWLAPGRLWVHGFLLGTAHGVLYPTMNALLLEAVPSTRRGFGMAVYNGAFNVGMAAGGYGWGTIAARYGYPALFYASAVVAFIASAVLIGAKPRSEVQPSSVS